MHAAGIGPAALALSYLTLKALRAAERRASLQ